MSETLTRVILWFAALALGIHLGAAVYEMVVITPLWAGNPPQSVRGFNPVAEFAIEPLSYKIPAAIALTIISIGLLAIGIRKAAGHAWALLAGVLSLALVVASVLHAFPILERTIGTDGSGLTDAQIVEYVQAWLRWSRMRLAGLIVAWTSVLMALLKHEARPRRLFRSNIRGK